MPFRTGRRKDESTYHYPVDTNKNLYSGEPLYINRVGAMDSKPELKSRIVKSVIITNNRPLGWINEQGDLTEPKWLDDFNNPIGENSDSARLSSYYKDSSGIEWGFSWLKDDVLLVTPWVPSQQKDMEAWEGWDIQLESSPLPCPNELLDIVNRNGGFDNLWKRDKSNEIDLKKWLAGDEEEEE